jgi:hypothetical protein
MTGRLNLDLGDACATRYPDMVIAMILIAAFRNRTTVRSNPDAFEFKLEKDEGWARKKSYARWVSDVLIVHTGIALIRTPASQVEAINVVGPIEPSP